MTCHELSPDYAAYALGILDEAQRAEISSHLADRCPACLQGVAEALATVGNFSGSTALADPPARLRKRIVAMVDPRPQFSWSALALPWGVAAGLTAILIYVSVFGFGSSRSRAEQDATTLRQALYILNDPNARDATFGAAERPSSGRVFVSASRGVVFVGSNLPQLSPGKTFEMWIIPTAGNPIPAGTFQSEPNATAVHIWPGAVQSAASAVAVTIEPDGGSPQPTMQPFIVASL